MKVAGWILNVISLIALVVGVVFTVVWACVTKEILCKIGDVDFAFLDFAIVCYLAFVALGFAAHMIAEKITENDNSGYKFVYFSSYPAFILPYIVVFIVKQIIKLVKILMDALSGNSSPSQKSEKVYIVFDEHQCERKLRFFEYGQDHDPDSPFYTMHYHRFRDDIGNFWRSYDNEETFIKETVEQRERGY